MPTDCETPLIAAPESPERIDESSLTGCSATQEPLPERECEPSGEAKKATLKITIIGCPFRTTYGRYISSLRSSLESITGLPVQWVASNCCCGDPKELARQFETRDCDYFHMPDTMGPWTFNGYSRGRLKHALRSGFRYASNHLRVLRYLRRASGADVVHLQQTLNAYGFDVTAHLLRQCRSAAKVVTLHELDPEQTDNPKRNSIYNLADAIIVHDTAIKERLVSLGVEARLIHIVCLGTDLTEGAEAIRDGIVFYGGHHLDRSKGIDVLFQAYRRLKDRSRKPVPRLRIHGNYGQKPPRDALALAGEAGVADAVDWLNELPMKDIADLYRRSQVCVLPFKGSFAGLPAGVAAANRLPIIATRLAGVPDHIGGLGVWVNPGDALELSNRIEQILYDAPLSENLGTLLRTHAEQHLGWDSVARGTLAVYQFARARAKNRKLSASRKSLDGPRQPGYALDV